MIHPEIEMRARLASNIKRVLFPDTPWPKVVMAVAGKINALRHAAKPYYPDMTEIDFLKTLAGYSDEALQQAFDDIVPQSKEGEVRCNSGSPQRSGGELMERCMENLSSQSS